MYLIGYVVKLMQPTSTSPKFLLDEQKEKKQGEGDNF